MRASLEEDDDDDDDFVPEMAKKKSIYCTTQS